MKLISKIATVAAVAAMGVGMASSSASAYTITGGPNFTGVADATHTFTVAGAYTVFCDASFSGSVMSADTAQFTPTYTNCDMVGQDAIVDITGSWTIKVTGGAAPSFTGQIALDTGRSIRITVPALGCIVTVTTPQTFSHGVGGNSITALNVASPTRVNLNATVNNIAYTTNGSCPFGNGSDGVYSTNGNVTIGGLTIDN